MIGWHHQLNGHEFQKIPEDGEGQGSLACCSPWGHKESDAPKQLNSKSPHHLKISTTARVIMITPPGGRNAGIRELLLSLGPWEIPGISLGHSYHSFKQEGWIFKKGKVSPYTQEFNYDFSYEFLVSKNFRRQF